jgi:hypothetical protein
VTIGSLSDVSGPCQGQNAEVEQAVDPSGSGDVYEAWTGCAGIGFSVSTNGGANFSPAVQLPGSGGSPGDPDVAVGPDGTVYVSFVMLANGQEYPVVDASFDHGVTFPQVTALLPPPGADWGDSPNIAVGPEGNVYVTWDYGPSSASVVEHCSAVGSCSFSKGDLNVVVQVSTDGGRTFGPIIPISPGFPWSGADNAPIVIDPAGHLDVLYQGYDVNPKTHDFSPALNFFTTSANAGATWSTPVVVGSTVGTMNTSEWWNEPSIGIDAGGNLYAAWDTQAKSISGTKTDTGWLSFSPNGGATWSTPVEGPTEDKNDPHIMEVTGGSAGEAYVAWLSDSDSLGYGFYVRPFSITAGWLSAPLRISKFWGNRDIWPGDTFGLSTLSPNDIVASWGSAVASFGSGSSIFATTVTSAGPP